MYNKYSRRFHRWAWLVSIMPVLGIRHQSHATVPSMFDGSHKCTVHSIQCAAKIATHQANLVSACCPAPPWRHQMANRNGQEYVYGVKSEQCKANMIPSCVWAKGVTNMIPIFRRGAVAQL